jgi:hypothetical protein
MSMVKIIGLRFLGRKNTGRPANAVLVQLWIVNLLC